MEQSLVLRGSRLLHCPTYETRLVYLRGHFSSLESRYTYLAKLPNSGVPLAVILPSEGRMTARGRHCWGVCYLAGIQHKVQLVYAKEQRFKSACASAQSDQRLSLQPIETLDPWLPIERPSKTLIRRRGCTG